MKPFSILSFAAIAVLLAGCGSPKTAIPESGGPQAEQPAPIAKQEPSLTITTPQGLPSFTLQEIATHATSTDCWVAIGDKAYDLSPLTMRGQTSMTKACGNEASTVFDEAKQKNEAIKDTLANYEIGLLSK